MKLSFHFFSSFFNKNNSEFFTALQKICRNARDFSQITGNPETYWNKTEKAGELAILGAYCSVEFSAFIRFTPCKTYQSEAKRRSEEENQGTNS